MGQVANAANRYTQVEKKNRGEMDWTEKTERLDSPLECGKTKRGQVRIERGN